MSAWLAANRGDRQALCQELDSGADMEFKDPMGRTPLMEAAKHGHVACVQELLYRGADPTARSAVGWTAMDFCGSHESSHDEVHQLLGQAQQVWQENQQQQEEQPQQQQQQKHQSVLSQHQSSDQADKENANANGQALHELPCYSLAASPPPVSFSLQTSARHLHLPRQYTTDSDPSSYRGFPPQQLTSQQQNHLYQLHQQQQKCQLPHSQPSSLFLQSQRSFATSPSPEQLLPHSHSYPPPHSHASPMLSQDMLAQATLARLSKASTEAAISSVTSSMHSFRSSELSNVSNLGNSLLSSSLNSPFPPVQQSPATLSRPVCRYWHSGRCLYGAHCRFAHPAGPAPTPPPSVQPVCRYWRFGTCRYGSACRFRHPLDAGPVMSTAQSAGVTTKLNGMLPGFQTHTQQQQQHVRNMGLTDAEVLSLISQGSNPLQDTHSLLNTLQRLQLSQR